MTTQEIFSNMKAGGVKSAQTYKAVEKLVNTGLKLKEVWPFAFEKAFGILESLDEPGVITEQLGKFIEENCTYKAYIPYAKLVQLPEESSNELTDESLTKMCDLLNEIAQASVEYYTKKFSF